MLSNHLDSMERLSDGIADLRQWRTENDLPHPNGYLWWDDASSFYKGRFSGWKCCSVCGPNPTGPEGVDLRLDHCHQTGLFRGLLCNKCNLREGHLQGERWYVWRLAAPNLQVGRRSIYRYERYTREIPEEDLWNKPMGYLISRVNMFCIRDKRLTEVIHI